MKDFDSRVYNLENIDSENMLYLDIGDIWQISEVSLDRGSHFPEHLQTCHEFTYCVSGSATIVSNGVSSSVSEGQIHFVRSGATHRIEAANTTNFRYICLGLVPNPSNPVASAFEKEIGDAESFVVNDNGYFKRISEMLIRETYLFDEYSHDLIDKFISHILVVVTRLLKNPVTALNRKSKKSSPYAIYEILSYLDSNYLSIDSVSSVAKTLSYSESYLSHIFKEKLGITLKEYIVKKKIDRAMELLEQCDMSIEQVSSYLRFTSSRVFRRTFKQYTNLTPTQFRNK